MADPLDSLRERLVTTAADSLVSQMEPAYHEGVEDGVDAVLAVLVPTECWTEGQRLYRIADAKDDAVTDEGGVSPPPIAAAVGGALRYVAGLTHVRGREDEAREWYEIAGEVEAHDYSDSWCCPLCEEMTCDDGCPLESLRRASGSRPPGES